MNYQEIDPHLVAPKRFVTLARLSDDGRKVFRDLLATLNRIAGA